MYIFVYHLCACDGTKTTRFHFVFHYLTTFITWHYDWYFFKKHYFFNYWKDKKSQSWYSNLYHIFSRSIMNEVMVFKFASLESYSHSRLLILTCTIFCFPSVCCAFCLALAVAKRQSLPFPHVGLVSNPLRYFRRAALWLLRPEKAKRWPALRSLLRQLLTTAASPNYLTRNCLVRYLCTWINLIFAV